MTDQPTPQFRRGVERDDVNLVGDTPAALVAQRADPGVPSDAEWWWHRLDRGFNDRASPAWERGERGTLLCRQCSKAIGVALDVGGAIVLGLLIDETRFGSFVVLAVDPEADGIDPGLLRQAAGEVPTTAPCPRHGARSIGDGLSVLRDAGLKPGTKPRKKPSKKV